MYMYFSFFSSYRHALPFDYFAALRNISQHHAPDSFPTPAP
jgi:hypothetical protein